MRDNPSSTKHGRLKNMTSFIVMDILTKAQQYENVVHFEVGQPDIPPSEFIIKAMGKALQTNQIQYTEAFGLMELRETVSEYYHDKYGLNISPSRIMITPGTSGAFLIAYSILFNAGDRIGLLDPGYPCYKNFAFNLNIEPVLIPVDRSTDYQLTVDQLSRHPQLKGIHISTPSNPLGNLHSPENIETLIAYCESHNMSYISDELYHGLVYEQTERSALEFSENVIVINGLSKFFSLPGFRIGWLILPEKLIRPAEIVMQNLFICAPTPNQYAAIAAFDQYRFQTIRDIFRKRRDYLYTALKDIFPIDARPDGAFYLWADVSRYTNDSYQFAYQLLDEIQIAVTPGIDFGNNETSKYLRFSYARDIEHMRRGVERLSKFILKH